MTFFANIARKAEETLDSIAAMTPSHVKLNSDAEAIPTPPTIGISEAYTCQAKNLLIITAMRTADTTGSDA